jgi:general stress protein YciG
MSEKPGRRPRGLAAMGQEKRREIARKGGQAAQARGTGYRWTVETARAAGKKRAGTSSPSRRPSAPHQTTGLERECTEGFLREGEGGHDVS